MTRDPQALLQLNAVTVKLGHQAFGTFTVSVAHGERIAILGPSGAGKTTLLKLMSKELDCLGGNLMLASRPLRHWTPAELSGRRAVLPQSTHVAFGLQTELVVALGRVARENDPALPTIVRQALQLAHATHLAGRRVDTLSGGEQARVQLARVFAQLWDAADGLILVDEPLASLDPGLQFDLLESLEQFAQQRGHAVVAILHDINHALMACKRLLLMKAGRLVADLPSDRRALPHLESLYGIRLRCVTNEEGDVLVMPVRRQPSVKELV